MATEVRGGKRLYGFPAPIPIANAPEIAPWQVWRGWAVGVGKVRLGNGTLAAVLVFWGVW